jgi:hypothetical protein
MELIPAVGARATQHGNGTFTRNQFITSVLHELSVGLCRQNANIERAVSGCFVRVSGGAYSPGLVQPTAEVHYDSCDGVCCSVLVFMASKAPGSVIAW